MKTLDRVELFKKAPSIFTDKKREDLSEKYKFFNTFDFIEKMEKLNWFPVEVNEAKSRIEKNSGYQKHVVYFQNPDINFGRDDCEVRIAAINSHDGKSSIKLKISVFRKVCSNGLIVENELGASRIIHRRYSQEEIENTILDQMKKFSLVSSKINEFNNLQIDKEKALEFAGKALEMRYKNVNHIPITADTLLKTRRDEDDINTVWGVLNVIQENMIQGGLHSSTASGRPSKTRKISNINRLLNINQKLWKIANKFIQN